MPGYLVTRVTLIALLIFVPLGRAAAGSDVGWDLLKSLEAEWEGKMGGEPAVVRITYRVVSNGSAVMEIMKTPETKPDMVTMYHRDGGALMLTHYCAAGNQPRMRVESPAAGAKQIAFRFADVTNLSGPDAPHMRDLTITAPDATHLVQEWTYREKGKDSKTVFQFVRVK